MKKNILGFILAGLFIISSCDRIPDESKPGEMNLTKKSLELIESDNQFGLDLFRRVAENDSSPNILTSPLSVGLALGMTYNGAGGTTKEAMKETLRLAGLSDEEINTSYKSIIDQLLDLDPQIAISIANSIWYKLNFPVEPEFIQVNQKYYYAEVNELDFLKPDAKDIINGWVNEQTKGLIPEIIDFIPTDAVMYLINAIYFKGIWKYEFDPENTSPRAFYYEDGSSQQISMMEMESELMYLKNDLFSAVSLPYGDGCFNMIILLPSFQKSLDDLKEKLTADNWKLWMNSFGKEKVVVVMPKFKFEFLRLLNQDLTDMGMGIAFEPGNADFSGINPDRELFISRVLHKTFVDVNEEGTEAAAVTAVEIMETSAGPGGETAIYFIVDKPFIFAIRENSSGTLLFMGQVKEPEYEE